MSIQCICYDQLPLLSDLLAIFLNIFFISSTLVRLWALVDEHANGLSISIPKWKSQSALILLTGITGLSRKEKKKYEDWKVQSLGGKVSLHVMNAPDFWYIALVKYPSHSFPIQGLAIAQWLKNWFFTCNSQKCINFELFKTVIVMIITW